MTVRDMARQTTIAEAFAPGACLTTADIVAVTGIERRNVADGCCRLISRGWIVRRERGCFELTATGAAALAAGEAITSGPLRPLTQAIPRRRRRQTARDRIWSTMRILRKFTLADLEMMTSASADNVMRYVTALEAAGYLVRLRKEPGSAPTSPGRNRWLLTRDTGPIGPVHRVRQRHVYDHNTGSIHPLEPEGARA